MTSPTEALTDECHRQSENCGYTGTTFTIWLRCLKCLRLGNSVAPVVFGALATWKIVAETSHVWAAIFAFLTAIIPATYRASKTDVAIEDYTVLAGEFTNLRDRFRQAALISSLKPFAEFEAEAKTLLDRLEKARARMLTPPEWAFWPARRKHKAGHYTPDYDLQKANETPAS